MGSSRPKENTPSELINPYAQVSNGWRNDENKLLVVSLLHGLFFSIHSTIAASCLNASQKCLVYDKQWRAETSRMGCKEVLHLLESAGYVGAARASEQLEVLKLEREKKRGRTKISPHPQTFSAHTTSTTEGERKSSMACDPSNESTMCWQRCFCICAAECMVSSDENLSIPFSPSEHVSRSNLTPLQTVLQATSDMYRQNERRPFHASAEDVDGTSGWFMQISHAVMSAGQDSTQISSGECLSIPSPRLFEMMHTPETPPSSTKPPTPATMKAAHEQQELLEYVFYTSMLYGALCISSSYTTIRPLATLLTTYIYQNCPEMKQEILGVTSPATRPVTGPKSYSKEDLSPILALTRLRGVISGLLEFTLCFVDGDTIAVRHALERLDTKKERPSDVSFSLKGISPEVGKSSSLVQSAVLLLMQLVQQTAEWVRVRDSLVCRENGAEASTGAGTPSLVANNPEPVITAKEIVHLMQELLFTVVLGKGTVHMSGRPTPTAAARKSSGTKKMADARASRESALPSPEAESKWMVVTRRALTLRQVDALCDALFPTLLQQLGWEWPWSEMLRQCRLLDNQRQPPLFPLVAWSSHQLIDTILMQAAQRTYPTRLQYVLPRSFHKMLEALELFPSATLERDMQEDEEVAEQQVDQKSQVPEMFPMPPYYANTGNAMVDYFKLSGLNGVRIDEVERILLQSTSVLPMIVQMRALVAPSAQTNETSGNSRNCPGVENEETDAQRPEAAQSKAGFYPLTAERAAELEARYRLEVLLASIVVYTQLRVPSQVQSLMQTLAPLFAKLSSLCCRRYSSFTSYIMVPTTNKHTPSSAAESSDGGGPNARPSAFGLIFSKEVERLIDNTGYQFYPLEWMPAVAAAFHHARFLKFSNENYNTSHAIHHITSSALPYSVFAAVAHQFGANFNIAFGSSGRPAQRHPAGASDIVVVPSFMADNRAKGTSHIDTIQDWKRAELFLKVILLDCFLRSRTSSCDLEGTMALAATRRVHTSSTSTVGGHGNLFWRTGGNRDSAIFTLMGNLRADVLEAFWAGKPTSSTRADKAKVQTGEGVRRDRDRDFTDSPSKRLRQEEAQTIIPSIGSTEAVETLFDLMLNYGAASFETTIEAKDIILTLMQTFLPSTALIVDQKSKNVLGKSRKEKISVQLLTQANMWAQEMVGSHADHSRVRMLLQQTQSSSHRPPETHNAYCAIFNSCTWDACSPAREILRQVPTRILEKINLRLVLMDRLTRWRQMCLGLVPPATLSTVVENARQPDPYAGQNPSTFVDPLLRHQWLQWVAILSKLDWKLRDIESFERPSMGEAEVPALSTAQCLWYSPYLLQSL